jgi:hypothetical protein
MDLWVPIRVLVTASRTWPFPEMVWAELDTLHRVADEMVVVHGHCPRGGDAHASAWCDERGVVEERHPADWKQFGRAAGPIRNLQMVRLGADVCLAFIMQGSRGASGCALLAEQHEIPIVRIAAE